MIMVKLSVTNVITDVLLVTLPNVLIVITIPKDLVQVVNVKTDGLMMFLHLPIVLKLITQLVLMI